MDRALSKLFLMQAQELPTPILGDKRLPDIIWAPEGMVSTMAICGTQLEGKVAGLEDLGG